MSVHKGNILVTGCLFESVLNEYPTKGSVDLLDCLHIPPTAMTMLHNVSQAIGKFNNKLEHWAILCSDQVFEVWLHYVFWLQFYCSCLDVVVDE